jgi:hypothetical protein
MAEQRKVKPSDPKAKESSAKDAKKDVARMTRFVRRVRFTRGSGENHNETFVLDR